MLLKKKKIIIIKRISLRDQESYILPKNVNESFLFLQVCNFLIVS